MTLRPDMMGARWTISFFPKVHRGAVETAEQQRFSLSMMPLLRFGIRTAAIDNGRGLTTELTAGGTRAGLVVDAPPPVEGDDDGSDDVGTPRRRPSEPNDETVFRRLTNMMEIVIRVASALITH